MMRQLMQPKRGNRGFTLVELLVVVALVALMLTQGIPWLQSLTLNSRRTAQINEFVSHINTARGLAVSGDDVDSTVHGITPCTPCELTLCKTTDGTTCETSVSQYWESGWLMFWDADGDGVVDPGDNDRLIRVHAALSDGSTLRGNSSVSRRITFDTNGFTGNNGSLAWCDSRGFGAEARAIIISSVGRVRSVPMTDSSVSLLSCSP